MDQLTTILQRFVDWLRERQIEALCDQALEFSDRGQPDEARAAMVRLRDLINLRSPSQVARMERARGLR